MADNKQAQMDRINRYAHMIERQSGKAVRPFRSDGYINLVNRYGTQKDMTERYQFKAEPMVPDDTLAKFYEGNGLFAKIIDAPAEEAIKHGFKLKDIADKQVIDFYTEALEELDWEETAMTAIKWARLFGGSIVVMLINDGRGLDEPLNWKGIKSIDDLRVYDRSVVQPDWNSMFSYDPQDPFRTRGSRLGMPEYYYVTSKYGNFTVHDSRVLTFQNGILPERTMHSEYQLWGLPEYIRLHRAIRDAEVAHGSATKMLDRSVQAVYKMQGLAQLMASEQGEDMALKRLQTIDMARGMLNSLVIDSEGEEYDFRQFQFSGVSDVIDSTCNFLSALTNIPQTILFGRSPAGMNATGESDLENWYSYCERIDKRMVKKNLRYLLSVVFQAGLYTKEVKEVPPIQIEFESLRTMSDVEKAELENKKASTKQIKAQTAETYVNMQAIDPSEVRKSLAKDEEFDIDNVLDGYEEEDLFPPEGETDAPGNIPQSGDFYKYAKGVDLKEHAKDPDDGNAPNAAPEATKLPQDMDKKNGTQPAKEDSDDEPFSVGVIVVREGKILSATRHNDFGYGLICGPGGHGEEGETPEDAAIRETEEEFGITPTELIPIGRGPEEPDTGLTPYLFLCTEYEGEVECVDLEMSGAKFRSLEELDELGATMFQPFIDGIEILTKAVNMDGGPGSGNWGHSGRKGKRGGSAKGTGGAQHRQGDKESGYTSEAKERKNRSAKKNTSKTPKTPTSSFSCDMSETCKRSIKSVDRKAKKLAKQIMEYREEHGDSENEVIERYGLTTMKAVEAVEFSRKSEKWSEEDKLLDIVYTRNGGKDLPFEVRAEKLNKKLYSDEELSEQEQAVVDHFSRCAEPIGRDVDLYRMVNKDYLESFCRDGESFESLVGKEITNKALMSTAPGRQSLFSGKEVCIKIRTPGDVAVCPTTEPGEGEIVIPTGSVMKITKVQMVGKEGINLPMWDGTRAHSLHGTHERCGNSLGDEKYLDVHRDFYNSMTKYYRKAIYVEAELIGYEST